MTDTITRAKKLFELGGHLGHRKSRLHPRARKYVYQIVDGVSIIDLEHTIGQIDDAVATLIAAAKEGKTILVVATKKSVAGYAAELAKGANMHFIVSKWLPGLLTNFNTITKNVKKLTEYKRQKEVGEWAKFVKHEQFALEKELRKLEKLYGGITAMQKLPDVLLVVDTKREKNSVSEARQTKIPVVAIVDTNCNPEEVAFPIMLNDDTPKAVEEVLAELVEAYQKHRVAAPTTPVEVKLVTTESVVEKPAEVLHEAAKVKVEEVKEEPKKATPKKKVVVKKVAKKTKAKK